MRDSDDAFTGLLDLITYSQSILGDLSNKTMIEIGSYAGESACVFAKSFKTVYCIDPFLGNYDKNDIAATWASFTEVEAQFDENVSGINNIVKVKATSDDALHLKLPKVDMVYIDGLHTYEQVKKDIKNYLPLLNNPGVMSGHDYHDNWHVVKNAIHERLGTPDMLFIDTSWAFKIK